MVGYDQKHHTPWNHREALWLRQFATVAGPVLRVDGSIAPAGSGTIPGGNIVLKILCGFGRRTVVFVSWLRVGAWAFGGLDDENHSTSKALTVRRQHRRPTSLTFVTLYPANYQASAKVQSPWP